jgi:hypothetical protein
MNKRSLLLGAAIALLGIGFLLCIAGFNASLGLTQYFPDNYSMQGRITLAISAALFIAAAASRD